VYICPICNRTFDIEDQIAKHSLRCWREHNPYHKSKPAPHTTDLNERKVNNEVLDFFANLQKGN